MLTSRWILALLAVPMVALSGLVAGVAHADTPIRAPIGVTAPDYLPDGSVPPQADEFDQVLDAEVMDDLVALTERIEQFAYVDEDGMVRLGDVTAEELGVTEEFMVDLRAAYDFSNELIEAGEFVVAEDFSVERGERFVMMDDYAIVDPGSATIAGATGMDAAPSSAVPDWNAYGYNSGAMFYNSYNTYHRYYSSYWNLCNTMSAYLRMPYISRNLQYFYAYNSQYLRGRCYQNTGVWYYLPYSSGCRTQYAGSYRPCYGSSVAYRPAYYWTQSNVYNTSCRCYQQNWVWQGYYCRY